MKLKLFITAIFFFVSFLVIAQKKDTMILNFSEFLKIVKENHPVSKQAALLVQSADAGILSARGNFDPRLYYNIDQKKFDNKNYWSLQSGGVKIPSLIGLELNSGVEQSFGSYLNPESVNSVSGMAYTQFSMPLLQGLLIDERRFALKSAKLFRELSLVEQKNMLNELFSKASKAYWEWVQSYYNLEVIREGVVLANQRFLGIIKAASLGENAAVDTLEASIQWQDREVNLQQQEMDFYSKSLMLTIYLWSEKNEPVQFSSSIIPPPMIELDKTDLAKNIIAEIDSLTNTHPNIISYQNKYSRLALEFKLKKDKLKPLLNVKFNPLYDLANGSSTIFSGVSSFKWGVGFQLPLLLRKERGEMQLTKLKLTDLNFEIENKKYEISNKVKASLNEYTNTKLQAEQYNIVVKNYFKLLLAEKKLFEIGESSVFMVNNREVSYLNAKMKLNDLLFKYRKASVDILYNSGVLYNAQ